jgi:hypothetical protein
MSREHEDLYLIILKYYCGTVVANQKGNPDYHTGYTYIKLEFSTTLNVKTKEVCKVCNAYKVFKYLSALSNIETFAFMDLIIISIFFKFGIKCCLFDKSFMP